MSDSSGKLYTSDINNFQFRLSVTCNLLSEIYSISPQTDVSYEDNAITLLQQKSQNTVYMRWRHTSDFRLFSKKPLATVNQLSN